MAELNPPSAERLARFEVAYMEALPGHPAEIEADADAQAWQAFYRRIHNLAGSGGAFDFPEISRSAGVIDVAIGSASQTRAELLSEVTAAVRDELGRLVGHLRATIEVPPP